MSLSLRGKHWQISYRDKSTGKWVRVSTKCTEREKAQGILDRTLRAQRNREEGIQDSFVLQSPTVKHIVDRHIADLEAENKASYKPMLSASKHILDFFGSRRAASVDERAFGLYQRHRLAEDAAPGTIDVELSMLVSAFRKAERDRLLARVPRFRRLVKGNANARSGFLRPSDVAKLLNAIEDEDVKDFAEWLALTGQRGGEAGQMLWSDVKDDMIFIRAATAKNGVQRIITLNGRRGEIIKRRLSRRRLGLAEIFHALGKPIVRPGHSRGVVTGVRLAFNAAVEKAGLPKTLIHDLRRSAARNMLQAGLSVPAAMKLTGHRSMSMFHRYGILDMADVAAAGDRLDNYLAGQKS
jgi:integrase